MDGEEIRRVEESLGETKNRNYLMHILYGLLALVFEFDTKEYLGWSQAADDGLVLYGVDLRRAESQQLYDLVYLFGGNRSPSKKTKCSCAWLTRVWFSG